MDPRRIPEIGLSGLAKRHKDNKEIIDNTQTRGAGIELIRFSCFRSEIQEIVHDVWSPVYFDYQETDEYGIQYAINNPNFNFTAETAGFWVINSSATFAENAQHAREIRCTLNGTTPLPQSHIGIDASGAKSTNEVTVQSNFMLSINEGDSLRIEVFQDSNENVDLTYASFQAFKIAS